MRYIGRLQVSWPSGAQHEIKYYIGIRIAVSNVGIEMNPRAVAENPLSGLQRSVTLSHMYNEGSGDQASNNGEALEREAVGFTVLRDGAEIFLSRNIPFKTK